MFTDVGFSFTLEPENLPKAMSASNSQHLPQPAGIAGGGWPRLGNLPIQSHTTKQKATY